ncbi:uncharacterized protein LOC130295423 [Hyla sarda]|uniref:uncharacterized protein LOC130295423 n=1 Tax=Hyla sarda TaxID=327740 RepID=UPI0024C37586|nr:uncharacterized protein LOC130295423 [Hyla sarda]
MADDNTTSSPRGEDPSLDAPLYLTAAQIQDLINKSVQAAMSSVLPPKSSQHPAHTSQKPSCSGEPPYKKGKASQKRNHTIMVSDSPAGEVNCMHQAVPEPACRPTLPPDSNRPLGPGELRKQGQRSARRTKPDSFVDSTDEESSAESEVADANESDDAIEDSGHMAIPEDANPVPQGDIVLDSRGEPFFDPEAITHPRSGDWAPTPEVSQYIEHWARRSVDKANRNKLKAECPRPCIPKKVVLTPEIDPILLRYLTKHGKYSKKGIERSFRTIQDRILDLFGPVTMILNLSEQAAATDQPIDLLQLRGWAQRAVCLLGCANTTCATERRRSILMRLDPQLSHLAETEPGPAAEGLLFGDTLIKDINKMVGLYTSLDKAQTSLKKSSSAKVFTTAGRSRSRSAGRNYNTRPYNRAPAPQYNQAPQPYPVPVAQSSPFFPPRGRPWRGRGGRGYPRSRHTTGY